MEFLNQLSSVKSELIIDLLTVEEKNFSLTSITFSFTAGWRMNLSYAIFWNSTYTYLSERRQALIPALKEGTTQLLRRNDPALEKERPSS
jgi:hypothetical protein